jgi:hypothetical protein
VATWAGGKLVHAAQAINSSSAKTFSVPTDFQFVGFLHFMSSSKAVIRISHRPTR